MINFKEWSGASSHRGDLFTCDIAGTEGYQTVLEVINDLVISLSPIAREK